MRVGIPWLHTDIVFLPVDELSSFCRILLREQAFDRLLGSEVRIAIVEIPVGEGEAHRLVERVYVAARVVAHRLHIDAFEDVERLIQHRSLDPMSELVDFDVFVGRHDRLFDVDFPFGQVFLGMQPALLLRASRELLGDVPFIEALVGGVDRFFARGAFGEGFLLRLDELFERCLQIRLPENLARVGSFPLLARVRQKYVA